MHATVRTKLFDTLHEVLSFVRVNLYRSIRRLGRTVVVNPRIKGHQFAKFSHPNRHVFFGYYDVTPFSPGSEFLLAAHGPDGHAPPTPSSSLEVGFYDLRAGSPGFHPVGKTTAWCWQQGCRLQWCPSTSNTAILYNHFLDGRYGCVIQDIHSRNAVRSLSRPVYSVTSDGRWGLSLNFSRLHRLRPGYGYVALPDPTADEPAPKADGIWRVDMTTGDVDLLFSLAEIAAMDPLDSMAGAEHYFNHILWNPGATRFLFFHLWLNHGKRFSRLITCDRDGADRYVLINEGHVSHYAWKSDIDLLAYSTHSDTGARYHLYRDQSETRSVVAERFLTGDGHPSYSPDGSTVLVDSYPDRFREQHVFLYSCGRDELRWVGAFFSPSKFDATDVRCDLHPRWSPCGRFICVDSACEGKRAMYVLDVTDLLAET